MTDEVGIGQYISPAIALISAIGAMIAAFAALRSAQAAKDSNDNIENIHKSDLYRQVSLLANKVLSTAVRVYDLGNDLKLEYETQFSFAGQSSGGRKMIYIESVEKKQQDIQPMQEHARKFLEGLGGPHTISIADLVRAVAEFEGNLTHLERMKEKFIFDINEVRADNRLFRQKVITE